MSTTRRPEDEELNENGEAVSPTTPTTTTANNTLPSWGGGTGVAAQAGQLAQNVINMNYEDFTKGTDYASLAKRYSQQGRKAMEDTIGMVAARTGGLASSYATAAGNQAYNDYMTKLEDAARALYDSQRGDAVENYGIAQGMYDRQYSEWQDNRNFGYQQSQDAEKDAREEIKVQLEANANGEISPELLAASGWSEGTIQAYRDLYAEAEGEDVEKVAKEHLTTWIANGGSVTGDDVPDEIKAYIQASGYSEAELAQMAENRGYTTSQKQAQEQVLTQFAAGRYPATTEDAIKIAEETGWDVATVLAYQDYYEKVADEDATKESMAADAQIIQLIGADMSWNEIANEYSDLVEDSNFDAVYWQNKITQHEQNKGFTNEQLIAQDEIQTMIAAGRMPNQTQIAQSGRSADYWAAYKNAMSSSGGLTDPDDVKTWTDMIMGATPDKVGGYFSALDKIDEDLAFSLLESWAKASPKNRGAVFEELIGEPLD
jgi:hypothetical protein